jgi:hypothetical protein
LPRPTTSGLIWRTAMIRSGWSLHITTMA